MVSKSRAKHRKETGKEIEECERESDPLKEVDARLTPDQKQKIHDLAHSRTTTTEDY
jgi:hypothetical protein